MKDNSNKITMPDGRVLTVFWGDSLRITTIVSERISYNPRRACSVACSVYIYFLNRGFKDKEFEVQAELISKDERVEFKSNTFRKINHAKAFAAATVIALFGAGADSVRIRGFCPIKALKGEYRL